MKEQKYHLYLSYDEYSRLIQSLIRLKGWMQRYFQKYYLIQKWLLFYPLLQRVCRNKRREYFIEDNTYNIKKTARN